jgi:F-type H+-transporting ATPase subunit a
VTHAILAAEFHPPTTKDFVFDCYFGVDLLGIEFCFNFIIALLTASVLVYLLLFFLAFRKPRVVPGKLQALMEMGVGFVREQIAMPMLGPATDTFLPLLATFFFFILFMNLFEIAPWVNFSASSRVAFPLVLAVISWVTYNGVGIAKHGPLGYLKFTCVIPAAPWWIQPLLIPIEFVSNIVIRPITLTIRLTANFVAGHFLLALAFLGTEFFFLNGGLSAALLVVSVPMSIALVAFELILVVPLQAFIFAVLSASYIGGALAEEH